MYQHNWYGRITDELLQQLPEAVRSRAPTLPKLGRLDVTAVRLADYFIT